MDGGSRRSQPRSVINRARSDAADTQPEATPPPVAKPPVQPPSTPRSRYMPEPEEPGFFKKYWGSIAIIAVLLTVMIGGFFYYQGRDNVTAIDTSKYQAVFFTNGQVYFGKLQGLNSNYMTLTSVYYLQSDQAAGGNNSENPQDTSTNKTSMQLVKLGKEIHGPEDKMIISKDQILFYENLKPDGKVAESILKYDQGK